MRNRTDTAGLEQTRRYYSGRAPFTMGLAGSPVGLSGFTSYWPAALMFPVSPFAAAVMAYNTEVGDAINPRTGQPFAQKVPGSNPLSVLAGGAAAGVDNITGAVRDAAGNITGAYRDVAGEVGKGLKTALIIAALAGAAYLIYKSERASRLSGS